MRVMEVRNNDIRFGKFWFKLNEVKHFNPPNWLGPFESKLWLQKQQELNNEQKTENKAAEG